jgi:hypothetical protein
MAGFKSFKNAVITIAGIEFPGCTRTISPLDEQLMRGGQVSLGEVLALEQKRFPRRLREGV